MMKKTLLTSLYLLSALVLTVVLLAGCNSSGEPETTTEKPDAVYYVAPDGNDSNPGTLDEPWATLDKANKTLKPGETVYVRAGTYKEQIKPLYPGGAEGKPITYAAYEGEKVILNYTGNETCIHMPAKFNDHNEVVSPAPCYITIDGFTVDTEFKTKWGQIEGNSNIVIKNCEFLNGGERSGILFTKSEHVKILNNRFLEHGTDPSVKYTGNDSIKLEWGCSYFLIEGNHFENSNHACVYSGGQYVVVRDNYVYNKYNHGMENGQRAAKYNFISRFNLWENNTIITPFRGLDDEDECGLEFEGHQTIVRYNLMYNNSAGCLSVEGWDGEVWTNAVNTTYNRFYNNTLYNGGRGSIAVQRWTERPKFTDNVFKNNILYNSCNGDKKTQLYIWDAKPHTPNLLQDLLFIGNCISAEKAGEKTIELNIPGLLFESNTLSHFQQQFPDTIDKSNFEADPMFVDQENDDFNLREGSPCIDAGQDLTLTTAAGTGTVITVEDARYFYPGYGVVEGDMIIIGSNKAVEITDVNYKKNEITVEKSVSWEEGDAVNLVYKGTAPDVGAFEY